MDGEDVVQEALIEAYRKLDRPCKMPPMAFLDPSAFIATNPEPQTLVSECDFFVQFWRTRKGPNQFADAMRDAE
jgi:hypothetical protein